MKKLLILSLMAAGLMLASGCGTPIKTTEYDAAGHVTKVTESNESPIKSMIESTKDKQVLVSDQSYLYGLRFIPPGSSTENPLGIFELIFGRQDKIILTTPMEKIKDMAPERITEEIKSARSGEISISPTGGSFDKR